MIGRELLDVMFAAKRQKADKGDSSTVAKATAGAPPFPRAPLPGSCESFGCKSGQLSHPSACQWLLRRAREVLSAFAHISLQAANRFRNCMHDGVTASEHEVQFPPVRAKV